MIPADAGLDDAEFDLRGPIERADVSLADQGQRPVQPTEGALTVGHGREVLIVPGQAAGGPELGQGLGPAPGLVCGDPGCLPDHADAGGEAPCGLGVLVTLLWIVGHSRGDQVTGHRVGQVVRQAVQLGPGLGVELLGGDRVGEAGPGRVRCAVAAGRGNPGTAPR